jgi:thiamine biosynthesis lipoprotein
VTVRTVPAGWQHVQVDGRRVNVPPGVDLGATAKALAADLAVSRLDGDALLSLGGDIATKGSRSWPVLVTDTADPDSTDTSGQVVAVTGCLATSSTTARRWTRGGRVVHHLLDPRTGLPVAPHWRTVSVLASSCLQANVASTAAVVLGTGASRWLNDRGLDARLVAEDGTIVVTGDWPEEG